MSQTRDFYDGFADSYHFLYMDWQKTVHWQSDVLSAFLQNLGCDTSRTVLDVTCGIGTQAIALALAGYPVHGRDLSRKAIERAREFAAQFATVHPLKFEVGDLLAPVTEPPQYDVVLAYDNPIAHFHTEQELRRAFQTMAAHLNGGGLLTTSLRDYTAMAAERPRTTDLRVHDDGAGKRIMFQVLDWHEDASGYDSEMFVITQRESGWHTQSYPATFRAWRRDAVLGILADMGLSEITWHTPEHSGYYQPIVTARKSV